MPRLILIGAVAGLFSALFGVGGGIVIVPLLILAAGVPAHVAAATSLAAIGITALAGATRYGFEGHLDIGRAALLGLPAAVGAVVGATLAQRVDARPLTLGFAVLLASIAVWLLV
ncbi:MAG: sulfite exporter TauE/SafE family protein [Actinobacteria bacterium]|nr:sulfite exporter TauE/SafE family protein [Actinomycetota bacterium]